MARDEDRQRGAVSTADGDGGFGGALADLTLAIGHMSDRMKQDTGPRVPYEACHDVWATGQIALTSGAGTLDQRALYGPNDPYVWDVRAISLWGFTAGTVTVYLNSTNGEQIGVASTAGQFTWSSQVILHPSDRLIFVAASITGSVNVIVRAIQVHAEWLAEYLM